MKKYKSKSRLIDLQNKKFNHKRNNRGITLIVLIVIILEFNNLEIFATF